MSYPPPPPISLNFAMQRPFPPTATTTSSVPRAALPPPPPVPFLRNAAVLPTPAYLTTPNTNISVNPTRNLASPAQNEQTMKKPNKGTAKRKRDDEGTASAAPFALPTGEALLNVPISEASEPAPKKRRVTKKKADAAAADPSVGSVDLLDSQQFHEKVTKPKQPRKKKGEGDGSQGAEGGDEKPKAKPRGKKKDEGDMKVLPLPVLSGQLEKDDEEKEKEEGEEEEKKKGKGRRTTKKDEDEDDDEDKEELDDNERNNALFKTFTKEQMERYAAYRQSKFPKSFVRKRMASATTKKVGQTASLIMGGITKIHVGELIENARVVQAERGQSGPLKPDHIRAAHERLVANGLVPYAKRAPVIRHR